MSETTGIELLEVARAQGQALHDMPPEATAVASTYGIYTTSETRDPGTLPNFLRTQSHRKVLGAIAASTDTALRYAPNFAEDVRANTLGSKVATVLGAVTAVRAEGIAFVPHDREGGGTAQALRMSLEVPSKEEAHTLAELMQALHHTPNGPRHFVQTESVDDKHEVSISNVTEHTARALARISFALMDREDTATGITLPLEKNTATQWRENGETFRPELDTRLTHVADDYTRLTVSAEYIDPAIAPVEKFHAPLGTDVAAVLQGMRDVFKGVITHGRGGNHLNPAQDPFAEHKLTIETGIDLRRDPACPEDVAQGPKNSRSPSTIELVRSHTNQTLQEARKTPVRTLVKMGTQASSLIGLGALDALATIIEHAPSVFGKSSSLIRNYQTWRSQKRQVNETNARLDTIVQTERSMIIE